VHSSALAAFYKLASLSAFRILLTPICAFVDVSVLTLGS
jgi:hypothetical protein